ncbi:glycosyltransferase [Hominisplanchenecus murintestinalis]|jgi:glycosyltransferase involved in cell wall biosynthesis|uniref:glycosyltransferase n=1 Tax=Hominisplanchenecus murintestinalis TaxID=2941517 RepID=UPI00203DFD01|nr:glycosyltransferase [Hominisplanchenecus murintestinalis]
MNKILYYTARDMTNPLLGINKKIRNQIETLRKSFCVDAVYRKNDSQLILEKNNGKQIVLVSGMKRPYKVQASHFLSKYLQKVHYSGCYIRYVFADGEFHKLLKVLAKAHTKVIIEIPTYPYDAEMVDSLENRIVLLLDKLYRKRMKPYVSQIATYSYDKEIYGIEAFRVINGVDFGKISIAQHPEIGEDGINVIAVADLARWHGYDRLLEGIGRYYKQGGTRKIHFYMVGEGEELKLYQSLVGKYGIQDKVTFCGALYGEQLDEIYNRCTLAVECLGAHRKGLKMSSSLKSREYAAKGLPMLTAVDIDIFCIQDYPYIYKVEGNEMPIDMEKVIEFYDSLYTGKDLNSIAGEIREHARKLCDMDVVMKPVADCFL